MFISSPGLFIWAQVALGPLLRHLTGKSRCSRQLPTPSPQPPAPCPTQPQNHPPQTTPSRWGGNIHGGQHQALVFSLPGSFSDSRKAIVIQGPLVLQLYHGCNWYSCCFEPTPRCSLARSPANRGPLLPHAENNNINNKSNNNNLCSATNNPTHTQPA